MSNHSLKGKAVLIGGGAKNLGGLISRTFAAEGACVGVHYNSSSTAADAEKTVADIKASGGEAFAVQGDFTKVADVTAAFTATRKQFGGIDVAINTVGKVLKKPIIETTEAEYDSMAAINAKAAYFFIQEAGKQLNDHGKICTVVTSLLAAYTGLYAVYAGMKAPVEDFTPPPRSSVLAAFPSPRLGRGRWTLPSFTARRPRMPWRTTNRLPRSAD